MAASKKKNSLLGYEIDLALCFALVRLFSLKFRQQACVGAGRVHRRLGGRDRQQSVPLILERSLNGLNPETGCFVACSYAPKMAMAC